ncbi:MAG TPA: glycosyltransferase family 39 protein [Pyrinomonadaceae bacterium]|jgi:4-amino-4-deoxy-L-arabinose transferase-like glycosyltransferase
MDESLHQAAAGPGAFVFGPRRALPALRAWARARAAGLACAALLAFMASQMLSVVWQKSITVDEVVMIPAAYYHLAAANCQLVHEHPPFVKILAGVPLLFLQPDETDPTKLGHAPDSPVGKWTYCERFWEDNPALFESISFWARVPMVALSALTGLLLFAFARDLFGDAAAVLAVALYTLEPTLLAHGRVVQTDVAASFGYLLVFYALHKYLGAPTSRRALLLGAAGGLACLTKFSMLMTGPLVLSVLLARWWRGRRGAGAGKAFVAHAGATALAALVVINAAYFFDHRPLGDEGVKWVNEGAGQNPEPVVRAVEAVSYVLPTDFVLGVLWQFWHNRVGHNAGLLGMYSPKGWWYYFPVAFALKATLPFLLLSLASLGWGAYRLLGKRDRRFLLPLAAFAVYAAASVAGALNLGIRYFLPGYMLLFVTGGALLARLWGAGRERRAGKAGAAVAAVLLGWTCVEAARAYPNHMSYMNQLAYARPHWWYLSDSNVEWGDDTRALAEYLRSRGETKVRAMFLGGFLTLHHYGVDYLDALAAPPGAARYTAVGASFLNGSTVAGHEREGRPVTEEERVNTFDEYRRRTPEKVFGGSIYLFREDGR